MVLINDKTAAQLLEHFDNVEAKLEEDAKTAVQDFKAFLDDTLFESDDTNQSNRLESINSHRPAINNFQVIVSRCHLP